MKPTTDREPRDARSHRDEDARKGALEGDRPEDEQQGNPHGKGLDEGGWPDNPAATAEDALGAAEDESQG